VDNLGEGDSLAFCSALRAWVATRRRCKSFVLASPSDAVQTNSDSQYDVFMSYNQRDEKEVFGICEQLRGEGLRPWLDQEAVRPGLRWQEVLEEEIERIPAAAVFVGDSGIGPWQRSEINAILRQFARRRCPVIPVLLPSCSGVPQLPALLEAHAWVDFRKASPDPLRRLIWGVKGQPSARA